LKGSGDGLEGLKGHSERKILENADPLKSAATLPRKKRVGVLKERGSHLMGKNNARGIPCVKGSQVLLENQV